MTTLPPLVLLIGLGLAVAAVLLLWKLLVTAAGIGLGLWLLVHATADAPGVQLAVFAVAGLAVAAALRHLSPSHGPALAGHHTRARSSEEAVR